MALKNQALTVCYVAWNTSTNAGQTGDAANHTLKLVQDGTEAAPTNSPAEVDSTNAPGLYKLALTAGDINFNCVALGGKSSTASVAIIPLIIVTERGVLPTVAPNTNGGFPILSSSGTTLNYTISTLTTYTGNTPQTGDAFARLGAPAGASIAADIAEIEGETDAIPSAAAIATAVWQDATAGDFTVASSIGKSLYTSGVVPGGAGGLFIAGTNAATTITTGLTAHIIGTVDTLTTYTGNTPQTGDCYARLGAPAGASVSADIAEIEGETDALLAGVTVTTNNDKTGYSLLLTQALSAARNVSAVADTSLTLNDGFHCAIAAAAGQETVAGTTYTVKTPSTATTLRIFTLDSGSAPTSRT